MGETPLDRGVKMLASIIDGRAITHGWKDRIPRLDRLKMLPLRQVIREFKARFEGKQDQESDRCSKSGTRKLKCYEGYGVRAFLGADSRRSGHTVVSAIQASDGCVCFIVVFNALAVDSNSSTARSNASFGSHEAMFPRDAEVVLKEPVLSTVRGSPFPLLFVQSPVAVEMVGLKRRKEDPFFFKRMDDHQAEDIRLKGNEFFAAGKYVFARLCYDASIAKSSSFSLKKMAMLRRRDDEECVLASSNRAEVFLRCQRYEEAIVDCNQVLAIDPRHAKCLYRKATALAALQQHRPALELLAKALDVSEEKAAIKSAMSRCSRLLKQSESGVYDLDEFLLGGCCMGRAPECADYVGPVEIRMTTDGRGRGLFVTRRVRAGELLVVANPIVYVSNFDRVLNNAELQGNLLVETIRIGRSSTRAFKRLDALRKVYHDVSGELPDMTSFSSNREVEHKITKDELSISPAEARQILKMSSFGPRLGGNVPKFAGIWGLPGLINHSCLPDVASDVIGRAMMIRAARDLDAGEEMLLCYVECLASWREHRRDECYTDWGFTCKCKRCDLESKHHDELKRLHLDAADKDLELQEMAAQVSQLEEALEKLDITEAEKIWIRAGEAELYCNFAINGLALRSRGDNRLLGHVQVMEMLQFAAPGSFKTRFLLARLFLTCPEHEKERAMTILVRGMTSAYGKIQATTLLQIAEAFGTDEGVKKLMGV